MAAKHRQKNPVNIDRYGDLFYDLAGEFDELVVVATGEVFEGDETIDVQKLYRAKKLIAGAILKAWIRMQKGK